MSDNFYIKQNDTAPSLEVVLTSSSGRAKPMTEAATVSFNMSTDAGVNVVSQGVGTIVNSAKGIVAYTWQTGDTSNTGIHNAEFQVTYNNGQIETFPTSGYIKVIIKGELA